MRILVIACVLTVLWTGACATTSAKPVGHELRMCIAGLDVVRESVGLGRVSTTIIPGVYRVFSERDEESSTGSAFAITDRHVITADHVIDRATGIFITAFVLHDGQALAIRHFRAHLLRRNREFDVAVLHIDLPAAEKLVRLPLRLSPPPQHGDAVSNLGWRTTCSHGAISHPKVAFASKPRVGPGFMEITAAAIKGDSGGPVVDRYGQVVGILLSGHDDQPRHYIIPLGMALEVLRDR